MELKGSATAQAQTSKGYKPLYLPPVPQEDPDRGRVILRDGSVASIRPSRPEDKEALAAFVARLSPESRMRRFFSAHVQGADVLAKTLDSSDPRRQLTLLVFRGTDEAPQVLAVGSYSVGPNPDSAEVAMVVDDAFQGQGLGTLLLERLSLVAVMNGIRRFYAQTHSDNRRMLDVFRNAGLPVDVTVDGAYTVVHLDLAPTPEGVEKMEMRDRLATAASLQAVFRPRSVAVVGASRDPESIGYRILEGLILNRFNGPVYPVNPKAQVVGSLKAYPSVTAIPDPVDLAIIVVPPGAVLDVVDQCGAKGVKALVVITAGFAEVGEEGRRRQAELVKRVRAYGMRMVGPNCLGVINTHPDVRLNASFSPVFPPHGNVAMSSQSGALGLAILSYARDLGLGLTTFVSTGNKADVSGNDLLQYWEEDEGTKVILLYLESFGNPRRFARIAQRVARRKPIVAVKGGRSPAGRKAASSHTAALAVSDVAVDALFQQTGVIRADTLDDMFDVAAALSNQPLPPGNRVGIVTNAGGPGILCADACEAMGLTVPDLDEETRARLRQFLPSTASVTNPVDMIASSGPEAYRQAIAAMLASPSIDALIVIYIPIGFADTEAMRTAIREGVAEGRRNGGHGKPVYVCLMVSRGERISLSFPEETFPVYRFPESAGRALGRAAAYAAWRRQPPGLIPDFDDLRIEEARSVCRRVLAERGGGWMSWGEMQELFGAFGLVLEGAVVHSPEEAAAVAERIGFPVVAKLMSTTIVHKTEYGGVQLNLRSPEQVAEAYRRIEASLAERGVLEQLEGVLVQRQVRGSAEVMVGVTHDATFGPLVAFGLGGIHVEVLKDVQFRVTPLTDRHAREMVTSIRGYPLLKGYRGHPPADTEALEGLLLRVSRMVEECPQIAEIDMNPIIALPPGQGYAIVDARVRLVP